MRSRVLVLSLGLALLLTVPMLAQIPTGTVSGKVTSADGEALPGVTVTVTSPSLQGSRDAVTSETGEYNIPLLPPGDYEVSFELEGFSNPKRSIKVSAAQAQRLDAELTNASVSEEIVVTGTYETISTSPEAATTYEKEFVEELPVERNIRETVLLTPGVSATGPGGPRTRGISIAGSQSYENLFLVNGVAVTENLRGQPFDLFIEDAVEETTTTVSGVSAEYGRFSGGVVNTITKSGGNEVHGTFRTSLTNQKWEEATPATVSRVDDTNPRYEATLGGWLWRDRLWYFAAGRDFKDDTSAQTFETNLSFPVVNDQQRYEGKLTLSPYQGHRIVGSYIKIDEEQQGNRFGNVLDLASLVTRTLPQELTAINYTGVITENFFVEGQYSERNFTFEKAGSKFTDLINGTLMVDGPTGRRWWSPTFCGVCTDEERNNKETLVKGSWFLTNDSLGSHDLSFGYDTYDDVRVANNHQSGSDFRIIALNHFVQNGIVYPVLRTQTPQTGTLTQYIQFNPILKSTEGTSFVTDSYFVNDKWRLNDHWSFNVGVRYDGNDGEDAEGKKVAKDNRVSPRLSAAWDPKGNGDWVFNLSYGEYVAAIANTQADSTSIGGNPATIRWNYLGPSINDRTTNPNAPLVTTDEALRIIFDWFNSQGGVNNTSNLRLVSIPGGTTVIAGGSLDSPYAAEYSVGFSKRLGSRGIARMDYVHRDFNDFYATRTDLSTGRVDTASGLVDLQLLENSNDGLERVYDGLHTQAQYRFGDRFSLGGVYTWSHLRGTFDGETAASGPVSSALHDFPEYKDASWFAPRGDLSIDQRHRFRGWAIYDLLQTSHHTLSLSLLQNYASGIPYGALGAVSTTGITNPGYLLPPTSVAYYFTNRDAFRTSDLTSTDLSFNYAFQWQAFGKGMEVYIQPEVLNVFGEEGSLNVNQTIFDATTGCPGTTNANCRVNPGRPFNNNPADPNYNPSVTLQRFNPLTQTPIEGINWRKADNFGKPVVPDDYQVPRTFRVSVGFRF